MMDVTRRPHGFSTPRVSSYSKQARPAEAQKSPSTPGSTSEAAAGAVQALSNNPSLRALQGESGFDGVKSSDKSAKLSGQSRMPQISYQDLVLAHMRRKHDGDQLDSLKRRVASLILALGKDDPLPKSGSSTNKLSRPKSPEAAAAAAKAATKTPHSVDGKQGPKNTQPVQPSTGEVEPLEKVLQVLQGVLKALEDAQGAQAGAGA